MLIAHGRLEEIAINTPHPIINPYDAEVPS
jgi:hypothetical protein